MGRVIHFEINADQPQRAVDFYRGVFGWSVQSWPGNPYWLLTTGPDGRPGINGAIRRREQPHAGVFPVVEVESVEAACAAITRAGGKLLQGKLPVPGVGWSVYCEDPEGNTFGLMQLDPDAK